MGPNKSQSQFFGASSGRGGFSSIKTRLTAVAFHGSGSPFTFCGNFLREKPAAKQTHS